MEENNQNAGTKTSGNEKQSDQNTAENPQAGQSWNNYQTKEMSNNSGNQENGAKEAAEVFEKEK